MALTVDSPDYRAEGLAVAVLPIQNLSGAPAPLKEIKQSLIYKLQKNGFRTIDDKVLERFMTFHRIRYTGGIDADVAQALRDETKADAVLITSLELYDDKYPPKIALISRLVSAGDKPAILWMGNAGLAGDDSAGILGLSLIEEAGDLQEKALNTLFRDLSERRSGKSERGYSQYKKKYLPKISYRSPVMIPDRKYTVAVLPFINESSRKNAGDIVALHFVRQLREAGNFEVIEPGIVRQELLGLRIIMEGGMSVANASLVLGILDADLVLSGRVMDYQDYQGTEGSPQVDFSVTVIERKSLETVWSSKSYNRGDDGVYFFDRGRINTAHAITSEMTRAVVELMANE
ncbi:MAG: hypothetical protein HY758_11595 [Nitrospirae bacterium]|nr:hypothetical protein [Nitrospirota bacterium]